MPGVWDSLSLQASPAGQLSSSPLQKKQLPRATLLVCMPLTLSTLGNVVSAGLSLLAHCGVAHDKSHAAMQAWLLPRRGPVPQRPALYAGGVPHAAAARAPRTARPSPRNIGLVRCTNHMLHLGRHLRSFIVLLR